MPITQDRMVNLINLTAKAHKGLSYWAQTAQTLKENAQDEIATVLTNDPHNALAIVKITERILNANISLAGETQPDIDDHLLLDREKRWFEKSKKQNDRNRDYMRSVRYINAEHTTRNTRNTAPNTVPEPIIPQPGTPATERVWRQRGRAMGIFDANGNIIEDANNIWTTSQPKQELEPQQTAPPTTPILPPENDIYDERETQIRERDKRALETGENLPP